MSLNIKNERVHELARRAAKLTGGSQTSAVEQALVALLQSYGEDTDQLERATRVERMMAMGARFRREEQPTERGVARVEDLYDEVTGLPR